MEITRQANHSTLFQSVNQPINQYSFERHIKTQANICMRHSKQNITIKTTKYLVPVIELP